MSAEAVVLGACLSVLSLLFVGYAVRKRFIWRTAVVLGASAALVFPLTVAASPVASAQGRPLVLQAHASPSTLPNTGGTVTVIGKVRGATDCRIAVLGDHGVKVARPKPVTCASGQYREKVGFGPDTGRSPVVVKLGLFASSARGVFYVVVAGSPAAPAVLSARATPWELPAKGGWTTVVGKVRSARACHLLALDWKHPTLPSQPCSSGSFSERLWLSPNSRHVAESQAFELVASGKGTAKGKFFIRLAPAPLPPPTTTATAATTTSAPPVTSSVTATPPPAFVLPPPPATTTSSTTTTAAPTTTTSSTTTTTTAPTATTSSTTTTAPTTTTTVAPTTTTTTAPPPTLVQQESPNWSGYLVGGTQTQPLTATSVTGTFTVPELTYAASCNDAMSVWNGIDGAGGTSGSNYLIQAGVALTTTDPYTGSCTPGQFYITPWWETITPSTIGSSVETFIETWDDGNPTANGSTAIVAGNQVTVTIEEVSSGQWNIILTDYNPNTGVTETFDYFDYYGSYVSYNGPGTSAEWIVEDTDQPRNPNCTWPGSGLYLCPMPAYDPAVSFTGPSFSYDGTYSQTDQSFMVDQNGNIVSQPSSIGTNGDFTVSYVGNGTNAPAGAVQVKTLGSKLPSVPSATSPSLSPQPHVSPR